MVAAVKRDDNGGMEDTAEERPSGADPGQPAQPVNRLRRSSKGEIGGVAAGLASYLGVEPLFFRIGFVVLTLFSGFGLVLYAACWLLLPTDDDPDQRPLAVTSNTVALIAGFVVLAVGSLMVANGVRIGANILIPVVLILFGAWVLNQRQSSAAPQPTVVAPPARPVRPDPDDVVREPADVEVVADPDLPPTVASAPLGHTIVPPSPPIAATSPLGYTMVPPAPPSPPEHWAHARPDGPKPQPTKQGPPVTSATLAASVVAVGALLVLRNLGGVDINATVILGAVLAVLGAGILVSAFLGRALTLVLLSFLVLPLLVVAPLIDSTLGGGIGARDIQVTGSGAELQNSYSLGIGELRLDLRRLALTTDETVEVTVGAGYTEIVVPTDLQVEVMATNRAGYVEIGQVYERGIFNDLNRVLEGDPEGSGSLKLIVDVTFGYAEVRRG